MLYDQNERRRQELDALALASSKNKLNKVAEALQYDATTIERVASEMNEIANNAELSEIIRCCFKNTDFKPTNELNYIYTLMNHAETTQVRAAIMTAYHNMKTAETRFN